MTNLDSICKSRNITLPIKVHIVKAIVFSVVMYGCESLTIKKAENQRIDAFKLWCWRRLLRVLCTAMISNQSILKEINPEYSLQGLMQKLWCFGHLMWRINSLEKTLILGKIEGKRKREWQRMRWLDGMADSMDRNLSKLQDTVENRGAWCAAVCGVAKGQTWSSDWTTPTNHRFVCSVVRVYFCFVNNFSCIIFFLDSTYVISRYICLSLTYFT